MLEGFRHTEGGRPGLDLYAVPGWDYPTLCLTYSEAHERARRDHRPAILHVTELTQPLGHSTSGSHERYKTPERLQWEKEFDCLRQMRKWILASGCASEAELDAIEEEEKRAVTADRDARLGGVSRAARARASRDPRARPRDVERRRSSP